MMFPVHARYMNHGDGNDDGENDTHANEWTGELGSGIRIFRKDRYNECEGAYGTLRPVSLAVYSNSGNVTAPCPTCIGFDGH